MNREGKKKFVARVQLNTFFPLNSFILYLFSKCGLHFFFPSNNTVVERKFRIKFGPRVYIFFQTSHKSNTFVNVK